MVRWGPDARGRLERAALELFDEQGFAATTVPEITARAGLTTRTFFRHFADKREVFFAGDEIPELARRMLATAPPTMDALTLVEQGLRQVAVDRFDGRRDVIRRRRALVAAEPALRERDAQKAHDLVAVIRPGLEQRGLAPLEAALLAELTVVVLHVATDAWLDQTGDGSMGDVVGSCFEELRSVLGPPGAGRAPSGGNGPGRPGSERIVR